MKKTPFLLTLALALVVGASLIAATGTQAPPPAFGFEVDLQPLPDTPGGFRCQATFRDLGTDEVLAAPRLVLLKGTDAQAETEIPGRGQIAALRVEVAEDGILTYELEVRAGEKVVSRHKATVALGS